MECRTFSFTRETGWSVEQFPPLDSENSLVLVFGGTHYFEADGPLQELVRAYPQSKIAGCSSSGEIFGSHISDDTLSVAVLRFEKTRVRIWTEERCNERSSSDAGAALAKALLEPDLRALFLLSDGLCLNGTDLLRGIHAIVGPDVVVTGGLAGDGTQFKRTWVLGDGGCKTDALVGVGLYGHAVGVSHGSRGGWDVFGPERVVTRSAANVLYELDGEPALALYKAYLGDRAQGLPATALLFPLALRTHSSSQVTLVRSVLGVDEANQSMTFAGDIPTESIVQLMRANFDRVIEGASQASEAAANAPNGDCLTLAISCVGRRIVLGERTEEEVEAALENTNQADKFIGFYSYGEISPFANGTCSVLHNQTMTLTRLWET